MMKYIFNTLILMTLLFNNGVSQIIGKPPAQTIPQFQFFRLDSTPFTDKDVPKGKMVFFMFFDPDCDHCQHAIKSIGDQFQSFKDVPVFLISIDDQNKINHFMDTYGSKVKGQKNVTILRDKLQQFIIKFNPVRYPSMFLFAADKKLIDYEDNPESVFRFVNAINKNAKH